MAKNTIKAVFVVNSTSGGGAENSMIEITRKLRKQSSSIHLCAINSHNPSELNNERVGVWILDRKWKSGLVATAKVFFEFRRTVRNLRPQVIVTNCELPELYAALGSPRKTVIIAVEHTTKPWVGRKILGFAVRMILKIRNVYWVTVSSDSKPIWFGSKFPHYIANPISIEEGNSFPDKGGKNAVFIGRLRAEKRPDWLVSSAIENGISVDIFGEGNQSEMLKEKYSDIPSKVRFHGYVHNPWSYFGRNSIVVVPSEYEGDGMVIAEAILRNHSILLADNPDLRRFALPDTNYFQNKGELSTKLRAWKESTSDVFRIPEDIIKQQRKARDIDTIVKQWEVLITKLQSGYGE